VVRCLFLAMLLFAGCRMGGPGESTPFECKNKIDDDGDGREDCKDPGCRALEVCVDDPEPTIPPPPPPNTMFGDPMAMLPLGGSRAPISGTMDAGDALDAGEEPPPQEPPVEEPPPPCEGLCTATQSCIDGECKDVTSPKEGHFVLRVVSARVPSRGTFGICLDMDCSFPFDPTCPCKPDPLTRVLLVRQPAMDGGEVEVIEVGRTVQVTNDVTPTFPDETFELELEPGDALRFEVWDADVDLNTAQFVFECRPDLRELAPGYITCSEAGIGGGSVVAEIIEMK
jgi:hypothetical protein